MSLVITLLALIVGVLVLGYGADMFVSGASKIARRFGIPAVVIGLTVVAFGTSAPEMAVNIMAAVQGNSGIAYGNVVGSNIFNVLVILGVCAAIQPLVVGSQLIKIDIPLMAVASAILWWFSQDGSLGRIEALVLFALLVGYVALQVKLALNERQSTKNEFSQEFDEGGPVLKNVVFLLIGLALLVVGARMFVYGAVELARLWGVSEQVIALTIVSAGTSLPEVATSVAATLKGEREIAVGNVVGSNIFNILAVLGLSGLLAPSAIIADVGMRGIDLPIMVLTCVALAPLAKFRGKFERPVGVLFVAGYIVYVVQLIGR
ncbi:MAG: calcium/sodium antiporter [Bacteriovoracia bacterium]